MVMGGDSYSNPSTVYRMDNFSHLFVVKFEMFV